MHRGALALGQHGSRAAAVSPCGPGEAGKRASTSRRTNRCWHLNKRRATGRARHSDAGGSRATPGLTHPAPFCWTTAARRANGEPAGRARARVCVCTCVHARTCVHMCARACTCLCVRMCVCARVHRVAVHLALVRRAPQGTARPGQRGPLSAASCPRVCLTDQVTGLHRPARRHRARGSRRHTAGLAASLQTLEATRGRHCD